MLFGINYGFWFATGIIALVVLSMNLVFWNLPPGTNQDHSGADSMYGKDDTL